MRESTSEFDNSSTVPGTTRDEMAMVLWPAFHGGPVKTEALQAAVCAYVDGARERGDPVERVIVDLKRILRLSGAWRRSAPRAEEAVAEDVIRWCIERYYQTKDRHD